jgi:hypothetical protein
LQLTFHVMIDFAKNLVPYRGTHPDKQRATRYGASKLPRTRSIDPLSCMSDPRRDRTEPVATRKQGARRNDACLCGILHNRQA